MRARHPVQWFLTESGRAFSMYGIAAAAVGLTGLTYGPQTFFLDKYKDFVQYYSRGKEMPLNKDLEDKYKTCLEILKVPETHKKLLQPFSVFGFDLFHAGSCTSRFGALVGIPSHFYYKTKADIDKEQILVNQKKVDWESDAGQKLQDALVLPENVKLFGICREILATQNSKIYFDACYPMVCVSFIFTLGQIINHKANLYAQPRAMRATLYTILCTFGVGLYFFLKDFTEVTYETWVDKKLCEIGPEFIESGVIFYDKLLKRNQALRELMGNEGEDKYTKLGNEKFSLRQPRIALVHRKMFFESEMEKNKKDLE